MSGTVETLSKTKNVEGVEVEITGRGDENFGKIKRKGLFVSKIQFYH